MYNSRKRATIEALATYANTYVVSNAIVLHNTKIATLAYDAQGEKTVSFFNGGFTTRVTSKRINEICEILKIDWRVAQKSKEWVWRNFRTEETKPHAEGIKFNYQD